MAPMLLDTVFPRASLRLLSNIINFFGVSIITFCFSRRTAKEDFFSRQHMATIPLARWCVILLFIDSWIFIAFNGVLIDGIGLGKEIPCALAMYGCIVFYASSKALIYMFLVEKVHVVWRSRTSSSRFSSPVYRLCCVVLLVYIGVFVLLVVGKISYIRDDQSCVIGLTRYSSVPLLSYDLFANILFTSLFLWPVMRTNLNPRLRTAAIRTLIAAIAALTTSCVNIAVLTVMKGQQLGWLCLGSCGTDVILNALVMYWVTAGTSATSETRDGPISLTAFSGKSGLDSRAPGMTLRSTMMSPSPRIMVHDDDDDSKFDYLGPHAPPRGSYLDTSVRSHGPTSLKLKEGTEVKFEDGRSNSRRSSQLSIDDRKRARPGFLRGLGNAFKIGNEREDAAPVSLEVTIMTELDSEENDHDNPNAHVV